jgi:hypothetical protein
MIEDLGWCINSYGQVEYVLGDLVWHALELPEYANLAGHFPLSLQGRIKYLLEIFSIEGRLSPYATDVRLLMERLVELSEPRHMFAHGHCTFLSTPSGDAAMLFRRFIPPTTKGGAVTKYEGLVRPASLREARCAWTLFASSAQRIFARLYLELGLEDPGVARSSVE